MAKKNFYKPNCLMSIHGYLSTGEWQSTLQQALEDTNLRHRPYKYGFKISPFRIGKESEKFRDWYFNTVAELSLKIKEPFHRPSIIAHSLGSWILAKSLLKYPELKFDKVFLQGSIVPSSFDWFKLILRGQVNSIICEISENDKIVPLGFIFTGKFNPSGKYGISQKSSFIKEEHVSEFGHSTFQYKEHFKEYVLRRLSEIPHQLSVTNGSETIETEIKRFFKESNDIDLSTYPEKYTNSPISFNIALDWYRMEKDIWSFVKNIYTNEVLAYINAVPVDNETYRKFMNGELSEIELNPNSIQSLDISKKYNLIVLSIAIRKDLNYEENTLHKGRIAELLIMAAITKINNYSKNKLKLKRIGAAAWTPEGEKLCKGFCMVKSQNSSNEFPYYEIHLKKINRKLLKEANFMSKWWFQQKLKLT